MSVINPIKNPLYFNKKFHTTVNDFIKKVKPKKMEVHNIGAIKTKMIAFVLILFFI